MRGLIPDTGLRGPQRVIWVDAKYKAHLSLLLPALFTARAAGQR
jgi:hypothetical protein